MDLDWSHRADYMAEEHGVGVEEANEALVDPGAVVIDPDTKSRSGQSARVIGYSTRANAVLVVILVHREDRPAAWWGANGWRANIADQHTYWGQNEETENGDE